MGSLSRFLAPLSSAQEHNLEPSRAWESPEINSDVPLDHGPIMVTVEYEIDEKDGPDFREALEKLRIFRYQNGVVQWSFFVDIADPRLYREVYFEESWGAHLRHHERVTSFETQVATKVYEYHRGEGMPKVFHYAVCDSRFPLEPGARPQAAPTPREYETDSRGIPLWFVDDLHE